MKLLRLAFLLPALVAVAPAQAQPALSSKAPAESVAQAPLHYATLDRMIRTFAEQARSEREDKKPALLARR